MQVTGKIPTTAHAGYFIDKVREKHLLRELIKTATSAIEQSYSFTGQSNCQSSTSGSAAIDSANSISTNAIQPPGATTVNDSPCD